MTLYNRILTIALVAVLVGVARLLGRDVPLTPAHRPKPSAEARVEIIDRRRRLPRWGADGGRRPRTYGGTRRE